MENKKHSRSVSIIVAMSPNRAIGWQGRLPWNIPEDLHHFKKLTWGNTIIMGYHTFLSLPNGALPGRRNIVLSRTTTDIAGCDVYDSLQKAIDSCEENGEIFVIGGEEVYRQALPLAEKLYITLVDDNPPKADAFFPPLDETEWIETKKEKHPGFSFSSLHRRTLR